MRCKFCDRDLDPDNPKVFRETLTWVSVVNDGQQVEVHPKYTDSYACDECIATKSEENKNLRTLFDFVSKEEAILSAGGDLMPVGIISDAIKHDEDFPPAISTAGEVSNWTEWQRGFEAGFRCDELLDPEAEDPDFVAGYDVGTASRAETLRSSGEWAVKSGTEVTEETRGRGRGAGSGKKNPDHRGPGRR